MESFSLEEYLSNGVSNIVKGILGASMQNPKASLFMAKHSIHSSEARKMRRESEAQGIHIPPFLIASITQQCNLHCKGCYARANHSCSDQEQFDGIMTAKEWGNVFTQAENMGIEFILLAGGEPFVRKDVIEMAGCHGKIIFPIFTNGTMLDATYIAMLEAHRNLMPVISIEGNEETTDARRGTGIYQKIESSMKTLQKKGILFGASVTVTKENIEEVLSDAFVGEMEAQGVKAVIYVEYVPVDGNSKQLAPDDGDREYMMQRLSELRRNTNIDKTIEKTTGKSTGKQEMVLIAFPGDEKTSGGCLAAGRGFFHINARGGAEPCPFSPYSDTDLKTTSLKDALNSPLFLKLQTGGNLMEEHIGGCVLFEQRGKVEAFLQEASV